MGWNHLTCLLLACAMALASGGSILAQSAPPPAAPASPAPPHIARERQAAEAEMQQLYDRLSEHIARGRMEEAEAAARHNLERARLLFDAQDGHAGVAARALGLILRQRGRPREAAPLLLRALEITSQYFSIGHSNYKTAVNELVECLLAAGQGNDALRLFARILDAAEKSPGRELDAAHYRSSLGTALRQLGRHGEAEAELRNVLALREKHLPADHFDTAHTLNALGGLMRVMGRLPESERFYLRAIEMMRRVLPAGDLNIAIALDNLATVYGETDRLADSERTRRQAVAIFEERLGPDHITTAQGHANLAALFREQGRKQEALALFTRAIAVFRAKLPPADQRLGIALDNLGGLHHDLGQYAEALKIRQEALRNLLAIHPETHASIATALSNLAFTQAALGQLAEAEQTFQRSLRASAAAFGERHAWTGVVHSHLGDLYRRQRRPEEARASYARAVEITEATLGVRHGALVHPLIELAALAAAEGQHQEAVPKALRAARIEVDRRRRQRLDPEHRGADDTGEDAVRRAVDIAWRAHAVGGEGAERALAEAFTLAQWLNLSAAGRSLAQMAVRLAAGDPALAALVRERQDLAREWSRLDNALIRRMTQPQSERDAAAEAPLRARLGEIETRLADIDASLSSRFAAFAALSEPEPLAIADVQRLVRPGEVLLQITSGPLATHVWAVSRNGVAWRRSELAGAALARHVEALRCGLDASRWQDDAGARRCGELTGRVPDGDLLPFDGDRAHALWREVVGGLTEQTRGRTLLIVAAGPLSTLPLQVLLTAPAPTMTNADLMRAPWLLKSNAVVVLPSVASLEAVRRQAGAARGSRPYLGVANPLLAGSGGSDHRAGERVACLSGAAPLRIASRGASTGSTAAARSGAAGVDLVRRLEPLPETADEVCAVVAGLGGDPRRDVLLGPDASEPRIRSLSTSGALADYRIVHFATHGLVTGEIRGLTEPALVLTPPAAATAEDDGLLTASEVATLRLNADAVLLSACNTAAGDGQSAEALSGLARAFFYAGARSLVVSHWPVDSDAAVRLVVAGFEELAQAPGLGRAEALRLAMLKLLSEPGRDSYAHPQTWAPFVIVGDSGAEEAAAKAITGALPAAIPAAAPTPPTAAPELTKRRTTPARAKSATKPKAAGERFDPDAVFRPR